MNLKLKTIILGVGALALITLGSGPTWAQRDKGPGSYKIALRNDGYLLHVTSNLIKKLPAGATLEITLDDPVRGKTTVRGTASRVSDTTFAIKTNQKFKFQPSAETRVMMRRTTGPRTIVGKGGGGCSGCPRDAKLNCEDPNTGCTMCWCFSDERGAQLNAPGDAELARGVGAACIEERKPVLTRPATTK